MKKVRVQFKLTLVKAEACLAEICAISLPCLDDGFGPMSSKVASIQIFLGFVSLPGGDSEQT